MQLWQRSGHTITLVLYAVVLCVFQFTVLAQAPPAGRPILFVHGICDTADSWADLRNITSYPGGAQSVINFVVSNEPALYVDHSNYNVYYDGTSVRTSQDGVDVDLLSGGKATKQSRFFSINFYNDFLGGRSFSSIDPTAVADISILNKADELAQVIRAITALTHMKDVIVIAHSMGGLDTRAYLENLAVPWLTASCTNDSYGQCAAAKKTRYAQDIGVVITIDTPHLGATTANIFTLLPLLNAAVAVFGGCIGQQTLNRTELEGGSYVIGQLNNIATGNLPDVPILALQSYTIPGLDDISNGDDGVVLRNEQSIQAAVPGATRYADVSNPFGPFLTLGCFPLHVLPCVGNFKQTATLIESQLGSTSLLGSTTGVTVQATFDGHPWSGALSYSVNGDPSVMIGSSVHSLGALFRVPGTVVPENFLDGFFYSVPPGKYTLSSISGGPSNYYTISPSPTQTIAADSDIGRNTWNLTFTIAFTSVPTLQPSVTTLAASGIDGGDAVLQATINPNSGSAGAWFEWGTDPGLAPPQTTPVQPVGPGNTSVTVKANLPGLQSNRTYYFRVVATGTGSNSVRGSILSFTTLGTLPAPLLAVPANGATGINAPPTFDWSPVSGAASYRLIVATNPTSLPIDPTDLTCGSGCVLNVTPTGNSYVPPSGALLPGTTYYWEVHARSVAQFGTWSAVFSFTTAASIGASPNYMISTVAGDGTVGFSGDKGRATLAKLGNSSGIAVDNSGNFYIADTSNMRVREVTVDGTILTAAGGGSVFYSDGGPATAADIGFPQGVAVDNSGTLYIGDGGLRVRKVSNGIITTAAGNGYTGFSGDGGPGTSAELNEPWRVAADSTGDLFIVDRDNVRIRKLSPDGTITTVAGNGTGGYSGDGGPATMAMIYPQSVAVDSLGNLFIADLWCNCIRKVTLATGVITTVAGDPTRNQGFSGDGGQATKAQMNAPYGVAVDQMGNLYIADYQNLRIRKVSANGIITTIAGNDSGAYSGDGGPATSAGLKFPTDVAVDKAGNVYVVDSGHNVIRLLTPTARTALAMASTSALPVATVGTPYSQTLVASGGVPPYNWSLKAGSLPYALSMSSGGTISGTPALSGTTTFTAQAQDATGISVQQTFTINVVAISRSKLFPGRPPARGRSKP